MKHVRTAVAAAVLSTGCAGVFGGPDPVMYTMAGVDAGASSAEQVAAQLAPANADFVLVAAEHDAAWFAELARQTNLALSGPALGDDIGLAFLSRLELLGDTAITLGTGDARFLMQDALYAVPDERYLDLMLVNLPAGVDISGAMRVLLEYMATDVMANASVVMVIRAATSADAASAERMLRVAFTDALECGELEDPDLSYRIFFGPAARTRCTAAAPLAGPAEAITARVSVGLRF